MLCYEVLANLCTQRSQCSSKISGPTKTANSSFSSTLREACSNAALSTNSCRKDDNSCSSSVLVLFRYCCDTSIQSECLRLSSTATNTWILIKGIELDQTPGDRLNAPGVYSKTTSFDPAFIRGRRLFGSRRLIA